MAMQKSPYSRKYGGRSRKVRGVRVICSLRSTEETFCVCAWILDARWLGSVELTGESVRLTVQHALLSRSSTIRYVRARTRVNELHLLPLLACKKKALHSGDSNYSDEYV